MTAKKSAVVGLLEELQAQDASREELVRKIEVAQIPHLTAIVDALGAVVTDDLIKLLEAEIPNLTDNRNQQVQQIHMVLQAGLAYLVSEQQRLIALRDGTTA